MSNFFWGCWKNDLVIQMTRVEHLQPSKTAPQPLSQKWQAMGDASMEE